MSEFSEETTPLERALSKGNKSQLECFLKSGVDPNYKDRKENSILYNAVKNKHYEIVSLLLQYKANPHFINSNGDSSIHLATRNADLAMCKILLDHGASLNCKNVRNQTPIAIALKENIEELIVFFYQKAHEAFDIKESNGKSLLQNCGNEKLKELARRRNLWDRRKVAVFCKHAGKSFGCLSEGLFKSFVLFL
jgi:ankyrin repeat protein